MKSQELRQSFINYFTRHGHKEIASSRLVPENDPTLLFTNAGMNQFKNVFLGFESRDYTRAVSVQKCVRAGGKHNDLENVGQTARHHTFFEMLGNFSFGDYFKQDAIHFAWEFLTKDLGLDKNKLYITVFETDDEAADIWHKQEGVPTDHIYHFGEKDNFWRMGNSGPCGPCSEIFYDFGAKVGGDPKENIMGGEGDRFVEIWNLVFMQYFEEKNGEKTPLPKPSIDTGAGLERLSTIMQGKSNNYDTDLFQNIIEKACSISGKEYTPNTKNLSNKALQQAQANNMALRVLADHARSTAFLISDGVLPSNEGRGYVLRRIMRRAIRYGRNLSQDSLLPELVKVVINDMGTHYKDLVNRKDLVLKNTQAEETRFLKTLDQGTILLDAELNQLMSEKKHNLSGKTAFKLYDTFGFPMDLTRLMSKEKGIHVDQSGFEKCMLAAKQKAKSSWKGAAIDSDQTHIIQISTHIAQSQGETQFTGYGNTVMTNANIIKMSDGKQFVETLKPGEVGFIILDKTAFYGESGGQVGDSGCLQTTTAKATVNTTLKHNNIHLLQVTVDEGEFNLGDTCSGVVTASHRNATTYNHSTTHLLHSALRKVLGEHVQQAGSLVDDKRLRFDFNHNSPLFSNELKAIEDLVNQEINNAHQVNTQEMSPEAAQKKGALALFGENYGDLVRVVTMGEFSMELCGGTHVRNTAEIGLFKIVSENGVSAGIRRIEAITGPVAREFVIKQTRESLNAKKMSGLTQSWSDYLTLEVPSQLVNYIEKQKDKLKSMEKSIQQLKSKNTDINEYLNQAIEFNKDGVSGKLILADIAIDDRKVLSELCDKLRDKASPAIVVLIGKGEKTNPIIVTVSKEISKTIHAGQILTKVAQAMGGKGGGRSDFAQGAAPDRSKIKQAFIAAKSFVH